LPYPLDDNGTSMGQTYKLWTKEFQLKSNTSVVTENVDNTSVNNVDKPWWKF
jgi:hypothetical protein